MRTLWPVILLAPLAVGCTNAANSWEGIWYLEIPVLHADACETDIDENYEDASAPDGDVATDWTFTDEEEVSPSALFVQVLGGKDGNVFVVIEDTIWPGTADAKSLQVTWTGTQDDLYREEHDEGYVYEESIVGEVIETITLMRDKETGGVSGLYEISSTSTSAWRESDRWPQNRVGIFDTQVPSYTWLAGTDPGNYPEDKDCTGDECELTLDTLCDGQVELTGLYAGRHQEGMFAAVEDATRTPGI